jgi:hypothetical protein
MFKFFAMPRYITPSALKYKVSSFVLSKIVLTLTKIIEKMNISYDIKLYWIRYEIYLRNLLFYVIDIDTLFCKFG